LVYDTPKEILNGLHVGIIMFGKIIIPWVICCGLEITRKPGNLLGWRNLDVLAIGHLIQNCSRETRRQTRRQQDVISGMGPRSGFSDSFIINPCCARKEMKIMRDKTRILMVCCSPQDSVGESPSAVGQSLTLIGSWNKKGYPTGGCVIWEPSFMENRCGVH